MKTKAAIAIFLLAIFALSVITMIQILPVKASSSHTLTLSDAELMLDLPTDKFTKQWGPGTLTLKTDIAGPGVQFDFTGLGAADTGVGDNFPVNALAGGTGPDNADFTAYSRYSMLFTNVGTEAVQVCLFMNTGFTSVDPKKDTYWASEIVTVGVGQSVIVTLDFSSCHKIWNAMDDPTPEWRHPDGSGGWPVQRLNEVSNIGFQVYSGSDGSIVVSELSEPLLYTDPAHIQKYPANVSTTFDVYVTLENFANFAGFDIKLTWDGTVITKTAVDYTTYLDALWSAGNWEVAFEDSGAGYYELVALTLGTSASNTGASDLFKITFHVDRSCNFPLETSIHFALVKLSDDTEPVPNPIVATVTDGMYYMSYTTPDLEFKVKKRDRVTHVYEYISPPYEFEYCDYFEVEVWVTDICVDSPLEDYDVTINFDPGLAAFVDVDEWGIFGTGTVVYTPGTPSVIHVGGNGAPWSGSEGLLFALTFHVEFSCTSEHIWKYLQTNYMTFQIWIADATLSFGTLGNKGMTEIITPSPLTIQVNFIRGDVDCDGEVDVFDLRIVAIYYGQPVPAEYDLTNDGIIDIYDLVTLATNIGYDTTP